MELMTDIQERAGEAASCFESKTRDSGEVFYTLKDGSPEWVSELVREAHGTDSDGSPSFLPDDWRYKWTLEALEWIRDNGDDEDGSAEFSDQAVSVYTGERIAWLGSNLQRASYCDMAAADYGHDQVKSIIDMIGWGQYAEAEEVYGLVLSSLRD